MLTNFRWYRDVFFARVFELANPQADIWKEKFISGFPHLLAEKVNKILRAKNGGSLNYDPYSYGVLIQ